MELLNDVSSLFKELKKISNKIHKFDWGFGILSILQLMQIKETQADAFKLSTDPSIPTGMFGDVFNSIKALKAGRSGEWLSRNNVSFENALFSNELRISIILRAIKNARVN